MTLDIAELERLAAAAAPGPWFYSETQDEYPVVYVEASNAATVLFESDWGTRADAAFIAAARTAVPALVARVRELERALAERERQLAAALATSEEQS